jgi:hypothetical protein
VLVPVVYVVLAPEPQQRKDAADGATFPRADESSLTGAPLR